MQIRDTTMRVVVMTVLISLVALTAAGAAGTVAADTDCRMSSPEDMNNCEFSDDKGVGDLLFADALAMVLTVAKTTLQYLSFVATFAGVTLWFTSDKNEDRAQTGMWLTLGGLAMIAFFFGYSTLISLINQIMNGTI